MTLSPVAAGRRERRKTERGRNIDTGITIVGITVMEESVIRTAIEREEEIERRVIEREKEKKEKRKKKKDMMVIEIDLTVIIAAETMRKIAVM